MSQPAGSRSPATLEAAAIAARAYDRALAKADAAREVRDDAIRDALRDRHSQVTVAREVGLSQPGVRKIALSGDNPAPFVRIGPGHRARPTER